MSKPGMLSASEGQSGTSEERLLAVMPKGRNLPPLASTLSVMFIPVLGVFSGSWLLGEVLHWQDMFAVVLIVLAIASVLWPTSAPPPNDDGEMRHRGD